MVPGVPHWLRVGQCLGFRVHDKKPDAPWPACIWVPPSPNSRCSSLLLTKVRPAQPTS